jgi:hypothetical protein
MSCVILSMKNDLSFWLVISANPTIPDENSFFTSVLVILPPTCIVVLQKKIPKNHFLA